MIVPFVQRQAAAVPDTRVAASRAMVSARRGLLLRISICVHLVVGNTNSRPSRASYPGQRPSFPSSAIRAGRTGKKFPFLHMGLTRHGRAWRPDKGERAWIL